jgi:hypothetical protein
MKQHYTPTEIVALITKVMAGFLGMWLLFLSVIVSSANLRGAHPGYTMRTIALFGVGVLSLLPNRKIVADRAHWIVFLLAVQLLIAIFIVGFVYEGRDGEWETPGVAYFIGSALLFNIGTFSAFLARSHDRDIKKGMLQQGSIPSASTRR